MFYSIVISINPIRVECLGSLVVPHSFLNRRPVVVAPLVTSGLPLHRPSVESRPSDLFRGSGVVSRPHTSVTRRNNLTSHLLPLLPL